MSIKSIVTVAYGLAGTLLGLLLFGGGFVGEGAPRLPLLTLLFVAEFGFFVAGGGAIIAIRGLKGQSLGRHGRAAAGGLAVACVLFLVLGVSLWRGYFATVGGV